MRCFLTLFLCLICLSFAFSASAQSVQKIWGNDRTAKTLFTEETTNYRTPWLQLAKTDKGRIEKLLEILSKSSTGQTILSKAKMRALEEGSLLEDLIFLGEGSLTDTTLVRRFLSDDPSKINYTSRSQVYINRSHNVQDALLDLAHELTHFTFREAFNPYVVNFSLKDFISRTIEGRGGEVDAYLVECKVLKETFSNETWKGSRCYKLVDDSGKLSRKLVVEQFYQVGNHYRTLKKELSAHHVEISDLTQLSDGEAVYISSAYGVPYPLAAVREYAGIMEKSCMNDYKRLVLMRETNSRRPASENEHNKLTQVFKDRCTDYIGVKTSGLF